MGLTRDDVRALLEAFEAGTWQEMTVEIDGDRIHVSRRDLAEPAPAPPRPSNGHPAAQAPETTAPIVAERKAAPAGPPPDAATGIPVVSPSVGLFWRAPSPDAPPFVEIGSRVGPEDTIGIVEVMKLMTPVAAGRAGTVSAVLVENGATVEHGQSLVLIAE
jgi:acetyl-CoA carboxylase biotin carboxyl carrier protein